MALKINAETSSGVIATYHKVANVDTGACRVTVDSYLSSNTRHSGKPPVTGRDYFFPGEFGEETLGIDGMTPKRLAYSLLKDHHDFDGAEDLL